MSQLCYRKIRKDWRERGFTAPRLRRLLLKQAQWDENALARLLGIETAEVRYVLRQAEYAQSPDKLWRPGEGLDAVAHRAKLDAIVEDAENDTPWSCQAEPLDRWGPGIEMPSVGIRSPDAPVAGRLKNKFISTTSKVGSNRPGATFQRFSTGCRPVGERPTDVDMCSMRLRHASPGWLHASVRMREHFVAA